MTTWGGASWTVLGSGTAVPHPERGCSGYLLRSDRGGAALFDTGSGTKDRMARQGVRLGDVGHLVYTHGHVDHWADLLTLLFYRVHAPAADRRPGLCIAGPPGFTERARSVARAASADLLRRNADLVWTDLSPEGPGLDGGWFRATPHEVAHGTETAQAYRVEVACGGQTVVVTYSGDASPCAGLVQAGWRADCMVCECAFPEEAGVQAHMTPTSVRSLADEARPRLLVLTHFYPEMLERGVPGAAFQGYDGRVVAAHDGLRIPLPLPDRLAEEP